MIYSLNVDGGVVGFEAINEDSDLTLRSVAKLECFKWGGKLLINIILYRYVLKINLKQIY